MLLGCVIFYYFLLTACERERLKSDAHFSRQHAFAQGSQKNLLVQWKSFFLFCLYFHVTAVPASMETICSYAQFLSRSFKSVQSIKNYISGVKLLHLLQNMPFPCLSHPEYTLLLRGLSRLNPHLPRQALPITPVILSEFRRFLDVDNAFDATVWCIFFLFFFCS
jgi:hypothetical protein